MDRLDEDRGPREPFHEVISLSLDAEPADSCIHPWLFHWIPLSAKMGSTMGDKEFNALSKRFGVTLMADRLKNIRVKRLFDVGRNEQPAKKIKKGGALSLDAIALIHNRVHNLNVIPGRCVFLTQQDWLKRDVLWLIDNCGWLFALIREEEEELIEGIKRVMVELKEFQSNIFDETDPVSLLSQE